MLFSHYDRYHYARSPLVEVICQLRFPAILSIGANDPVDFQEAIRQEFPRFNKVKERPAPKMTMVDGAPKMVQPDPITNYTFVSEDGLWKLNLTQNFIALSTLRYQRWEDFAQRLDRPLAQFIQIYNPTFFERVGLRYVNIFSRARLGLEGARWAELFSPAYTAPMQEAELPEDRFLNCACDLTLKLDSSCQAKVHAGPGVVKRNAPGVPQDPEVKFIFDMDLSMTGNTPCTLAAGALETLHGHSTRLFEGAVTDRLRDAMEAG